jgi:hypothetical protein
MWRDEKTDALVDKFHAAGKLLTSTVEHSDEEMETADQAQIQRLETLQELTDRLTLGGAATRLGMTAEQVEEELRVDRTLE